MQDLPKDPVMLLSAINLKLREDLNISRDELEMKLKQIDYAYDADANQFK